MAALGQTLLLCSALQAVFFFCSFVICDQTGPRIKEPGEGGRREGTAELHLDAPLYGRRQEYGERKGKAE